MPLLDVKEVQAQAQKENREEAMSAAKERLKELYRRKEKADLVVKNTDKDIARYLQEISELVVYEAAGVDTSKA